MTAIFCFTSTGNSLYTAKRLAERTGGSVRPMNKGPVQCDDSVIGFVFPVYFWGLPRMVTRFVSQLQITDKNAYVFAVITSGGPGFGVLGWLKKLLKTKGVNLQYGMRIISVSNYLPEYEPKDSEEIRQRVDKNISDIAEAVKSRQSNKIKPFTPLNRIAFYFCPGEGSDKHFTVSPSCTLCGTCRKVCPAGNISIDAGKPVFLNKCEHCLACVHHCPSQAIDWRQKTQGKPRYRHAGVSIDELILFNHAQNIESR